MIHWLKRSNITSLVNLAACQLKFRMLGPAARHAKVMTLGKNQGQSEWF